MVSNWSTLSSTLAMFARKRDDAQLTFHCILISTDEELLEEMRWMSQRPTSGANDKPWEELCAMPAEDAWRLCLNSYEADNLHAYELNYPELCPPDCAKMLNQDPCVCDSTHIIATVFWCWGAGVLGFGLRCCGVVLQCCTDVVVTLWCIVCMCIWCS